MQRSDNLGPLDLVSAEVVQRAALGLASQAFYDGIASGHEPTMPPSVVDCSQPRVVSFATLPTGRFVRFRTTIEFEQRFKFELGAPEQCFWSWRVGRFSLRLLHIEEAISACEVAVLTLDAVSDADGPWEKPQANYSFHVYRSEHPSRSRSWIR